MQKEDIENRPKLKNKNLNFLRQNKNIGQKEQEKYFDENIWPDMESQIPKNILFVVLFNNLFIGYGGFVHISWITLRAELSILF